mmetsp:Transcript_33660/g.107246  ORF Transcript_33660/g.107246 Transcript_33660/m.107246 type:complete len:207 (+) Transcript_33660:3585-4205(+)
MAPGGTRRAPGRSRSCAPCSWSLERVSSSCRWSPSSRTRSTGWAGCRRRRVWRPRSRSWRSSRRCSRAARSSGSDTCPTRSTWRVGARQPAVGRTAPTTHCAAGPTCRRSRAWLRKERRSAWRPSSCARCINGLRRPLRGGGGRARRSASPSPSRARGRARRPARPRGRPAARMLAFHRWRPSGRWRSRRPRSTWRCQRRLRWPKW